MVKMEDRVAKTSFNARNPTGPMSLNSLQLAIIGLKDKCQKQQGSIGELEQEKQSLLSSRENIYAEVKKLHQANEKLREKNLQLSRSLQLKSNECTELAKKLEDRRLNESLSARQIERLQNQVAVITHREETSQSSSSSLVSLSEEAKESLESSLETATPGPQDVKKLVDRAASNFIQLKEKLVEEQGKLQRALHVLQLNKNSSDEKVESLMNAGLSAAISKTNSKTAKSRKCPMCEAEFPLEISQDEFECHVVEHFSYEESETLRNFDTVPDAYWSCDNSLEGRLSSS